MMDSRRTFGGLFAICLLWAFGVLRTDLLSEQFFGQIPPLAAQAVPLALLSAASAAFALCCGAKWPRGQRFRSAIWIGLGLFTAPAILTHFAAGWISGFARTALFTLVPVFSVVLEPYIGHSAVNPVPGALPASLVALFGTLLVFPLTVPYSIAAGAAFVAVILAVACAAAANCYAVAVFRDSAQSSASPLIALAGSAGAASLGIASLCLERASQSFRSSIPDLLWAAVIDLPSLLLLFWLMGSLSAARQTTRFVLGPLIAVSVGALMMQIPLQHRTYLGLFFMAGGASYLLFAPEAQAKPANFLSDPQSE